MLGDEVDVYCNSSGQPIAKTSAWDGIVSRHATIIGFTETGDPILYFSPPPAGLAEYGNAWNGDFDRYTNARYDGAVDTVRRAFINGSGLNMSKTSKTGKVKPVKVMSSTHNNGEQSMFDMLKQNATTAAYRVATVQMTSGVKAAIIKVMENKGQSSERIQALKEMLDTEAGSAAVSTLLGFALQYLPMVSNDPRALKLAEEFRVNGMAVAGNLVADMALEHVMPIIMSALANLPAENATTAVRVSTEKKNRVEDTLPPEEAIEEKTEQKTLTA